MADESSTDSPKTEPVSGEAETQQAPTPEVPPEIRAALKKANKEAETLRLKLQQIEDRDKTEAQRLAERAEAAEAELTGLRVDALRSRVAISKGVPADLVEFLTGTTEEELAAQADRLLARLVASGRPAGDVDQGVRTTPLALNGDPLLDTLKNKLGIR